MLTKIVFSSIIVTVFFFYLDLHHTLSLISLRSTDTFDSMTTHVGSACDLPDTNMSNKGQLSGRRASSSAGEQLL